MVPTTACILVYAVLCKLLAACGFVAFEREITLSNLLLPQFSTSGRYPFTSPYWFIPNLFFVRVYFGAVHTRIYRWASSNAGFRSLLIEACFFTLYLSLSIAALLLSRDMYSGNAVSLTKIGGLHVAFAAFFYYLGFLTEKYRLQRYAASVLSLFVLYAVQQQLWATGTVLDFWMQVMKFEHPILPIVTSLTGIAFFFGISQMIAGHRGARVLAFIGEKGLPIVLHQLFGFFVLNLVLCGLGVLKPSDVAGQYFQWHTEKTWPLYVICGITVPLLIDRYVVGKVRSGVSSIVARWRSSLTG